MRSYLAALLFGLAATSASFAQDDVIRIDVKSSKPSLDLAPLTIPLSVPKAHAELEEVAVDMVTPFTKGRIVGQFTAPGIMTEGIKASKEGLVRRDLHVVLPRVGAAELVVHLKKTAPQVIRFIWADRKGEFQELMLTYSGRVQPFLRYMDRPYDPSSPAAREKTYKVFHHLYDPAGARFVTNGGFTDENITDPKKLIWPHHRGIMYGFNKCSYGPDLKMQADTWHCPPPSKDKKKPTPTAHVAHEKTLRMENGPVLGRHRVLLGWYGAGEKPFAEEERELTAYNIKGGTLVEFASRLKTTDGKVRVDGDPQHAGFQFRAANEVAEKSAKQTYFLHPDGKGDFGKERNWPQDKSMVDLPWYAVSFVLGEQRFTTCYLNHPHNPKETRFSERSYARIGGYFQQDITENRPLVVHYRLWLQEGEMTPAQAEALSAAFAAPPASMVK